MMIRLQCIALVSILLVFLTLFASPTPAATPFVIETVDAPGTVGEHTSLALDVGGDPHVSYYDKANGDLKYAVRTGGSWATETVDATGNVGEFTSIAVDAGGNPHITYYDRTNHELKYAVKMGGSWTMETIEGTTGEYPASSVAIDEDGNPRVAYQGTSSYLKYAVRMGGSWNIEFVQESIFIIGFVPSLAIDADGNPHVGYLDVEIACCLRPGYATKSGGSWSIETVDASFSLDGTFASLALDTDGNPHMSHDVNSSALRYAVKSGGSWSSEPLTEFGQWGSLALDPDGNPHMSFYDRTNHDLRYAVKMGGSWTFETVDAPGDVGYYTSLALDAQDNPHVSYYDVTNGDLKYAFVGDTTAPDVTVHISRHVLWPPNHRMVEIRARINATDNSDPDPDVALVSIVSDEPDNGQGDGNTSNDIQNAAYGTEDECFDLRSERQRGGDGRTYTIVYSATDNVGNAGYDTVYVCVPHDLSASAICSSGFVADGTSLVDGATTYALFILGSSSLEIATIDEKNIYVGNTAGVVRAANTRRLDINGDQRLDLAVMFASAPPAWLAGLDSPLALNGMDDSMDATVATDGPVGLHFATRDGVNYLVSNIYGLGTPVAMPDVPGKKTVTPEQEDIAPPDAPVATARVTELGSIHPNPFNPQTTVDFTLASSVKVRIAIYDVRGSLVRRLVDETMPAGQHQAHWNGADDAGRPATSGIYFARMIAGSYTEVRKIVMLK